MFIRPLYAAALAAALFLPSLAPSAFAFEACPQHYVEGQAPRILNDKLARATRPLCYDVFGIMHSGITRTPLWSAEHLTPRRIEKAEDMSRDNAFHAESRLPKAQRAELADYARSGFDRGHMAPSGNMPDEKSQYQSFTLANMVPQDADNNRHVWAGIESAVRKMVKKEGDLYVITGPAFLGSDLRKVGNVLVPSHLYKVVYSPRQRAGGAWFVANEADAKPQTMTIAQLERRIGIDLIPSLSAQQKLVMLKLPKTTKRKG
ncbi:DNA/RNA non-specific endonuclease [Pseudoduganella lutea]|uniref:Endonuclease n=1 Tax=Pseudoduganella lutea TaxID=321985 RepID=A0A4P6L443_9BURK|nr:DNA/RNA non-specific endonuclease [Pseudoduganella lutea]QBE66194.1 DNA/RNA non-specific endonuclease [Pseudoduganella lutea]